jgi:hydrogenase maturation protease
VPAPLRVLVAGVGNIFLSDDGFGSEVARRLEGASLPDGVRVKDFGIAGIHLAYDLLDGYDTLVLVDSVARPGAPGSVVVLEADVTGQAAGGLEAHSMDPEAVFATVRALGGEPPRTLVVGCVPERLDEGIGLSPAVAAAVDVAAAAVTELVTAELPRTEA